MEVLQASERDAGLSCCSILVNMYFIDGILMLQANRPGMVPTP